VNLQLWNGYGKRSFFLGGEKKKVGARGEWVWNKGGRMQRAKKGSGDLGKIGGCKPKISTQRRERGDKMVWEKG